MLFAGLTRGAVRRRRRRVNLLRSAMDVESGARALMSELCPHGWRARITVYGLGTERFDGAPGAEVALDWSEFEDEYGHVAVERRVWAPTIAEALEAMVSDRRTDETLEEIERRAFPQN